jgi:hypothetical protein
MFRTFSADLEMPHCEFPGHGLPAELLALIQLAPLPGLDGAPHCNATARRVESVLRNSPELRGSLTEAGIWLLAGDLNRSHEVSQKWETREGSYWHGIMHRREGDFWNAKYWFRKVGPHPVIEQLAQHLSENPSLFEASTPLPIRELSSPTTVAASLVDCCERALSSQPEQANAWQRICWLEWQFLFLYGWDETARQIKL